MSMTREEKRTKDYLITAMSEKGYPTYAQLLGYFDLNLTADPNVAGFMEPGKGRIVLNRTLEFEQVDVIIRHEILHEYLQHQERLLKQLEKDR